MQELILKLKAMIKSSILSLLILFSLIGYAQEEHNEHEEEFDHHCLFEEKSVTIGVGATYSFLLESVGVNSRFYYNLGEHLCFGPEFSFLKKDEKSIYDFNIIGHYIFETKWAGIYPLIGANYTIEVEKNHENENAVGLIVGGGIHRNFRKGTIFAEYSHVQSELKDDFATVGLMFTIK